MRTGNYFLVAVMFCSCAVVKKNSSHTSSNQRMDSSRVEVKHAATITETTIKSTAPGYTKFDSLAWAQFIPDGDTTTYEQNVKSGSLSGKIKSKPRKDGAGKVVGRDLEFTAVKSPETVAIPIDIHTITAQLNIDSAAGEKTTSIQQESSASSKDSWRLPAGFIICLCIAGLTGACIYFFKR
ncbi:hypothetical protein ACE38W_14465 [Chitinophaga sp. Hz27]|uniref:hypothetical protein n=1 Tax=Chitinophaga sp. Hz27 TaxID=3347169 RepID=UPI0035D8036C